MAEQHKQLLTSLGLPADQVEALETMTAEQLKEFKPDTYVETLRTGMKNVLSNDADFLGAIPEDKISPAILKKIESGQYARFQNEMYEVATKKLGLDPEKELTAEDKKSIKTMMEKAMTTYAAKNSKVEGLKEMQSQLAKALQDVDTITTQSTEKLNTELKKVNEGHSLKMIKTLAKVELQGLDGIDLAVGANIIAEPALALLTAKYAVVVDENDNLSLKQKANPLLEAMDDKGKKISFQDALREAVLTNKLGVEKKKEEGGGGGNPKKIIVGGGSGGTDDGIVISPHIASKINQNKGE